MMKANMLGLLLVSILSMVQPAGASSFTYNVNFSITSQVPDIIAPVTGTIVTDCNSCELLATDVISWSFNVSGGVSINSTMPGAVVIDDDVTHSPLSAQPTQIFYDANNGPDSNIFFELTSPFSYVAFDNTSPQLTGIASQPPVIDEVLAPSRPIAFIAPTPIPATLPLFATGLGAMGLFGWRRKRKAQGAIAAA